MCKLNLIDQHTDIAAMLWQKLCVWIGRMPEVAPENNNDIEAIKPRSPAAALAASDMQNKLQP
jgi:hypothetical protein